MKSPTSSLLCLVAFAFAFLVSGYGASHLYGANGWQNVEYATPAQSVDLGIRVVSGVAEDGTVTTTAIGRADDADFMAAYPAAKPLYFATGNLFVDSVGNARIGAPAETAKFTFRQERNEENELYTVQRVSNRERDLFGWTDTTGWKTSTELEDYPSATPSIYISGNDKYDIARAKLGEGWRLPTIEEWVFLVEHVTKGVTIDMPWSSSRGNGSFGNHALWREDSPIGITLVSEVAGFTGKSIFLPAVGYRYGNTFHGKGAVGHYWSGTRYVSEHTSSISHHFSFNSNDWSLINSIRYYGYAVRPVFE